MREQEEINGQGQDELEEQAEAGPEEEDDEDDYGLDAEFRVLETHAKEQKVRLKKLALLADRRKDPTSASLLRELMNVVQMNLDVVQATGAALEEVDERLESDGPSFDSSELTDEDQKELYGLLRANAKLTSEVAEAAIAGPDRDKIQALENLNREMIARVVDWGPLEEEELSQSFAE
jgi:hypothetical protein